MAVFDVLVNNGDRKGGHVLATPDGRRYGVDHGVSFHVENKLRTVLWGWVGQSLRDDERAAVAAVRDDAELHARLAGLISDRRGARLPAPLPAPARPGSAAVAVLGVAGDPVARVLSVVG